MFADQCCRRPTNIISLGILDARKPMQTRQNLSPSCSGNTQNPVDECDGDISTVTSGFALLLLAITSHQDVTLVTDMTRSFVFG
jgi:hypothetical protein